MMDEQTRFWIAQGAADTKYTADARPLFQAAKAILSELRRTLTESGWLSSRHQQSVRLLTPPAALEQGASSE